MLKWLINLLPRRFRLQRRKWEKVLVEKKVQPAAIREDFMPFGPLLWVVFFLALPVTSICFSGKAPLRFHVAPGQIISTPIAAEFPFSYESDIQTRRLRERKTMRIAPVYKLDLEQLQQFQRQIFQLELDINAFEEQWPAENSQEIRQVQINAFLDTLNHRYGFGLTEGDLGAILGNSTVASRRYLWNEGLDVLRLVLQEGIVDSALQTSALSQRSYFMNLDLARESEGKNLRTQEDALLYLRIHLGALDERRHLTSALFHVLRHGIYPNLTYDREKTDEKKAIIEATVKSVLVNVDEGEIIVGAGAPVGAAELEKLRAYRQNLQLRSTSFLGIFHLRWVQFLETFCILFCAALIVRTIYAKRQGRQLGTRILFLATMLIFNLLLLRAVAALWMLKPLNSHAIVFRVLPFMTPIFVGVILVSFELGRRGAMVFSLLLDIFFTLMIGKGLEFFSVTLLAMLLAVHQCHGAIYKSQILRIGTLSGLGLGFAIFWMTSFGDLEWKVGLAQALGATIFGLGNGLLAIVLLSPFERLFHLTSNLRLHELSDFNHKLLRQLQLYAPGTYHHSLMVANVAEQAAKEVGANSMLCRVAALFHDIGKITKPEYFIENQTEENPHEKKAPRISALIIKSHVREGMEVARASGIPPRVIQIMAEHHGNTLMQYFYDKARSQRIKTASQDGGEGGQESGEVEESFYRYDGPRPQSVEAAILMLVDSCEAASRSLQKVTPQSVESLVNAIFKIKTEDGQLDDCPITYRQINAIRGCIINSLVNVLHGRISYAPRTRSKKPGDGPTNLACLRNGGIGVS
ncbi:MAG: HDIG domain-containing protein [Puniceicoccales bacterium]|jgi:putative nucleotidyltransferase with HDIG domain|nr:HDIG domain-containing protein [Puniceicoccales bacterium]